MESNWGVEKGRERETGREEGKGEIFVTSSKWFVADREYRSFDPFDERSSRAFKRPALSLSLSRSFFFPGHASGLSTIDIPSMCQCKQKFNLIVLRIVLPPLPPSLSPSSHWPRLLSPSLCSPIFNRGLIVSRLALNLHRFNQISPISLLHGWKFDRRKNSLFFFFFSYGKS